MKQDGNEEQKDIVPQAEVFFDEYEEKAVSLYRKFEKEKSPELLLQASVQIASSTNPEAKQISTLQSLVFPRNGYKRS